MVTAVASCVWMCTVRALDSPWLVLATLRLRDCCFRTPISPTQTFMPGPLHNNTLLILGTTRFATIASAWSRSLHYFAPDSLVSEDAVFFVSRLGLRVAPRPTRLVVMTAALLSEDFLGCFYDPMVVFILQYILQWEYDTSLKLAGPNCSIHTTILCFVILKNSMNNFWASWPKKDLQGLQGAFKGPSRGLPALLLAASRGLEAWRRIDEGLETGFKGASSPSQGSTWQ